MTHRTLATLSRLVAAEVDAAEKLHDFQLAPADKLLLVESLAHYLTRDIDKFVRGAKHHDEPLVERVTLTDIEDELTDARFYCYAHHKRLSKTFA